MIVREGPLGTSYGHSGYFPGYLTDVRYYPRQGFSVALQVNSSTRGALTRSLGAMVEDLARIVADELGRTGPRGAGRMNSLQQRPKVRLRGLAAESPRHATRTGVASAERRMCIPG